MAEERLRRNLERAFDSGSDFPNRLLLSRTMAALEATSQGVSRHAWPKPNLSPRAMTLIAAMLVVALAVGATGAFIAINSFAHRAVPAGQSHARPGTTVSTVPALSVFSANDAAVWGPYNAMPPGASLQSSGLLITHDGGKTWLVTGVEPNTNSDPNSTTIETVSWIDADHIAVVAANSLQLSSDGGLSWRHVNVSTPVVDVTGVSDPMPGTVRISGSAMFFMPDFRASSHLYVSQIGGATWKSAPLPPPTGGWPNQWVQSTGPFMFGERGVFTVTSFGLPSVLVYITSDGGLTWSDPILATGSSLVAVGPDDWWMLDHAGNVVRTLDGGKSWQPTSVNPHFSVIRVTSIFPASGNVLWAIANGALPIRSTDAGAHWSIVKLP